jgi:hypothetical protein
MTDEHYEIQSETTIFDLVQLASNGDKSKEGFLKFIDNLVSQLVAILDNSHHSRFRKNILHPLLFNFGKDNFQSKYLEPVGELASLYQLLKNPRFQLHQIEFKPRAAKNTEGIDFCLRDVVSSSLCLVEVLNIEIKKEHLTTATQIKEHVYFKVSDKVAEKTKWFKKMEIRLPNLSFLVVLWCFDLESLSAFYPEFIIPENEFEYPLLEFCTFARKVDAKDNYTFAFGTVESILQIYNQHRNKT